MQIDFSATQLFQFKARPSNVDMQLRVMKDVIIAEVGEAEGHGVCIEQEFIDSIKTLSTDKGYLCNLGHNWDNMGLQFGRINNIRVVGTKAIGDLIPYKNADASKRFPEMATWVLNQADEDPESIMLSLRFQPGEYYQYNDSGERYNLVFKRVDYSRMPTNLDEDKPVFVSLQSIKSVDIVDDGALTNSMYSSNPDVFQRISHFLSNSLKPLKMESNNKPIVTPIVETKQTVDFSAQIEALEKRFSDFEADKAKLEAAIAERDAKIVELSAIPVATPAIVDFKTTKTVDLNSPEELAFAAYKEFAGIN